jgi:hypothetical protein
LVRLNSLHKGGDRLPIGWRDKVYRGHRVRELGILGDWLMRCTLGTTVVDLKVALHCVLISKQLFLLLAHLN